MDHYGATQCELLYDPISLTAPAGLQAPANRLASANLRDSVRIKFQKFGCVVLRSPDPLAQKWLGQLSTKGAFSPLSLISSAHVRLPTDLLWPRFQGALQEKEEGGTALGLDGEKVFSP